MDQTVYLTRESCFPTERTKSLLTFRMCILRNTLSVHFLFLVHHQTVWASQPLQDSRIVLAMVVERRANESSAYVWWKLVCCKRNSIIIIPRSNSWLDPFPPFGLPAFSQPILAGARSANILLMLGYHGQEEWPILEIYTKKGSEPLCLCSDPFIRLCSQGPDCLTSFLPIKKK